MDISTDNVLTKVDLLALSETWLNTCSAVEINGYRCIAEFKRANTRSGGVAIFENITSNIKATV